MAGVEVAEPGKLEASRLVVCSPAIDDDDRIGVSAAVEATGGGSSSLSPPELLSVASGSS